MSVNHNGLILDGMLVVEYEVPISCLAQWTLAYKPVVISMSQILISVLTRKIDIKNNTINKVSYNVLSVLQTLIAKYTYTNKNKIKYVLNIFINS